MKRQFSICISFTLLGLSASYGQNELSIASELIYSKVTAINNWSPSTAVNRQNEFDGAGLGVGVNMNYSFTPRFLFKNKRVGFILGLGYFKQRFDIQRPFNYESPFQPIFYTDNYAYHSVQSIVGLSYKHPVGSGCWISGGVSYSWLYSFRQDYTPTVNGRLTQTEHNEIAFGNMLVLAIGFSRDITNTVSVAVDVLVPAFTRWRNDAIFGDDTSTYTHPRFAVGTSVSLSYNFEHKH